MKTMDKTTTYKPAEHREKDLKLALYRIQKGRSKTGEVKVSIAAVAREAGVSAALIHNHYPSIAEAIREAQGSSSRAMRNVKQQELADQRKKAKEYRREIEELRSKVARLASINEVLLGQNQELLDRLNESKLLDLPSRKAAALHR